ncbi:MULTISPECIES: TFIIB-type zinc finger domain-containing protein [unclassified Sulfitobacter]|uniref:TFIIB-type zinc finger domain-containing protein n=1 Tax=unclassified Sulfitobacter TaxID=196795 RepID=UPI0007C2687D|nr:MULTISPECIES: TFIIB-type zinc finger domain-containing protein [unclassified Sulfitobacter]KZY06375.1 primosomal protein N' (replication factor Y) - superfamily II helicase [Sulfitobacter sp. HI0023]KZY27398.1 primosomal protein N' (replication factor Y) - superfamily II helicase [Sulfitobacter sp. HI0040]KZZ66053.1 primosomal protein N' (replication factor Y) - superfamily II helicase [Sulfitobacter sp. HI0129]
MAEPPPAPPAPEREHRFPCDTCGSDMRFDPAAGLLICDHCGNREAITGPGPFAQVIRELDFARALAAQLPEAELEETRVTTCPNCAAQVEFAPGEHATECPFCATPVVADTGTQRQIKPRGVLPFALTEDSAREAMTDWLGSLWFAPNGLRQYAREHRRMQGIYVPYWTFDANTRSRYSGQRGTVYYVTQTVVRDGKRMQQQVPKVRWTPVSGRVRRFFDDVLVLASTSLPKRFTDALAPWDLAALEPYAPEYLAGFRAEGYGVSLEEGFTEARSIMDRTIERDVKFDIGGDRQRIQSIDTDVSDVTFKHILLPVWLAAYKYRGRSFRFVVNGRTGTVQGERPYSAFKITIAVILGLLAAAIAGYFYAMNQ